LVENAVGGPDLIEVHGAQFDFGQAEIRPAPL
jgi:hypothetical protein